MYYFASDMHLGLDYRTPSRERERLLVQWLEDKSSDARGIFLVGDVFDFWFEYKRVVPKGFTRLLGKFSELTDKGIDIHFFTGNHDMWAYEYLVRECGLRIHYKPEVFELSGRKVYIGHGDNMYIRKPFMESMMQKAFHSSLIRRIFGFLVHPDLALRFGNWWSAKSRKSKSAVHCFRGEKEYLVEYAREYLKVVDVDYFVFGHLHCSENYDLGQGKKLLVLGEWIVNPTYALLDNEGNISLKSYPETGQS